MKKSMFLFLFIIGSLTSAFCQTPAVVVSDKTGWHKIGEATASRELDADEIAVVGADKFAFLKIKVDNAPINLISFEIYFEDGEKQSVPVGKEIKAAGETRTVQLKGGERAIKKVSFIYKTVPPDSDDKAHLELWGLKTNANKKDVASDATVPVTAPAGVITPEEKK